MAFVPLSRGVNVRVCHPALDGVDLDLDDEPKSGDWLRSQAAGDYVTYDPETGSYHLTPEQAYVLANEESPVTINMIPTVEL